MSEFKDKSALIMEHEETFAFELAGHVIDKPKLSLWMIMIPIFFVFYFFQLKKYKDGRITFTGHYMVTKRRALEEAVEAASAGRKPDVHMLAGLADMPDESRGKQADLLMVLLEHYTVLLKSAGEDFASLVRSAYGNLTNYLLFLNRLNRAEKEVNRTLKPHLKESLEGIDDVMSRMEVHSERLRRETAEKIFE